MADVIGDEYANSAARRETESAFTATTNKYTASSQDTADLLKNFDANYEAGQLTGMGGPFKYQADNPYMQNITRYLQGGEQAAGQQMGGAMAARGISDSGMVNRNIQQMKGDTAQKQAQYAAQDYLQQYSDYNQTKNDTYNQMMEGQQESDRLYQVASSNYDKQMAVYATNAKNLYQKSQDEQKQANGWKEDFGKVVNKIGTTAWNLVGNGLLKGIFSTPGADGGSFGDTEAVS